MAKTDEAVNQRDNSDPEAAAAGRRLQRDASERKRSRRSHDGFERKPSTVWYIVGTVVALALVSFFLIFNRGSSDKTASDRNVKERSFNELSKFGNNAEMVHFLEMQIVNSGKATTTLLEASRQKIEIADRLLGNSPSEQQRTTAITSKLKNFSDLYLLSVTDTDDPNLELARSARQFARKHLKHSDEKVRNVAHQVNFNVNFIHFQWESEHQVGQDNSLLDQMKDELNQSLDGLLADSSKATASAEFLSVALPKIASRDSEFGVQLMRKAADSFGESENETLVNVAADFEDEILVTESNLRQLFNNRYANGVDGYRDFYVASSSLIAEAKLGNAGLNNIRIAIDWFEKMQRKEAVENLCNRLLEHADSKSNKNVGQQARAFANQVLTRSKLTGEPFQFNAIGLDGKPIDTDSFKGQIVILAFLKSAVGLKEIKRVPGGFLAARERLPADAVKVILVKPSRETLAELDAYDQLPNWSVVVGGEVSREGPTVLEQHPIDIEPVFSLVDHFGNIYRINLPMEQLMTEIEFLINKKRQDR